MWDKIDKHDDVMMYIEDGNITRLDFRIPLGELSPDKIQTVCAELGIDTNDVGIPQDFGKHVVFPIGSMTSAA